MMPRRGPPATARGQTFRRYLSAGPIRRGRELTSLYLGLLGDFTRPPPAGHRPPDPPAEADRAAAQSTPT